MMTDGEYEVLERVRDRIRDLIHDHIYDVEARLAGTKLQGDPLGIEPMLTVEIEECRAELDRSGLGIFEQLGAWMDLIEAKGI